MRHKDNVLYVYLSDVSNKYIRALAKKNNLPVSTIVDDLIYRNIDMRKVTEKKRKATRPGKRSKTQ